MESLIKKWESQATAFQQKLHGQDGNEAGPMAPPASLAPTVQMRDYQLEGLHWLRTLHRMKLNGILADEMGLGKTLQSIAMLVDLKDAGNNGPFLVVVPLSLVNNWEKEFATFSPTLKIFTYAGDKNHRESLREKIVDFVNNLPKSERRRPKFFFDVFLTTYEYCISDVSFLDKFHFEYLIVDEATRLKNSKSLLYDNLSLLTVENKLLLSGTPVQNNLAELHSLLNFVMPNYFSDVETFCRYFAASEILKDKNRLATLQRSIKPFLLRREKREVLKSLPSKQEVSLYVDLTALQKRYYKAILLKDISAFESKQKTKLMNILMQLRKCVNHPYLFDGVEPEPFELGEHLIQASGKLRLLDKLLAYLKQHNHRVLIFSQMTRMLDILQDYLTYRQYTYERLDGSVRGDERYLAIKNFSEDEDTFVFLLSTRAGGVGLNLAAADVVILFDSDFNPQADLQAASRAHRIGQKRDVHVIRLLCRDTVEDIIMSRAEQKLKLSTTVIGTGVFSQETSNEAVQSQTSEELIESLKFGMNKLLESGDNDGDLNMDQDFDSIFAKKITKRYLESLATSSLEYEPTSSTSLDPNVSMYVYKGVDYSAPRKAAALEKKNEEVDEDAFSRLVAEYAASRKEQMEQITALPRATRKRTMLTQEEVELLEEDVLRQKRARTEENRRRREEKKLEKWQATGYVSKNLEPTPGTMEETEDEMSTEESDIIFVSGDVSHPKFIGDNCTAIVVICVDTSGSWGRGGLFTALDRLSPLIGEWYELAGENGDLHVGDCHLVEVGSAAVESAYANESKAQEEKEDNEFGFDEDELRLLQEDESDNQHGVIVDTSSAANSSNNPGVSGSGSIVSIKRSIYVALVVAQRRDKESLRLSVLSLPSLEQALRKLATKAKQLNASVHLPRIGQGSQNFNWYATERIIRKCFCPFHIQTFVYYYKRPNIAKASKYSSAYRQQATLLMRKQSSSPSLESTSERLVDDEGGNDDDDRSTVDFYRESAKTRRGRDSISKFYQLNQQDLNNEVSEGSITDDDDPDETAVPSIPGKRTSNASTSTMSNELFPLFAENVFYFHEMKDMTYDSSNEEDNCDPRLLQRYILAYDGEIVDVMDDMVTHIVAIPEKSASASSDSLLSQERLTEIWKKSTVVRPSWILHCINKRCLLPEGDYSFKIK